MHQASWRGAEGSQNSGSTWLNWLGAEKQGCLGRLLTHAELPCLTGGEGLTPWTSLALSTT